MLLGVAIVLLVFFFAPLVQEEWGNFGARPETVGWVSPSFAMFQCGAFVGGVDIGLPNGGVGNAPGTPFWLASSNWNCQYPHLLT
jgi:hypothetical protein